MTTALTDRITKLTPEERKLLWARAEQRIINREKSSDKPDSQQLVAYVKANQDFDLEALKSSLRAKVPEYMVPSQWVKLEEFPLLPNGKVNKKALRSVRPLAQEEQKAKPEAREPKNDIEKKLLSIWQEVLQLPNIGVADNFFDIGGDSILSIQVIAKARSAGIELEPKQLFEHQNVEQLANFMLTEDKRVEEAISQLNLKHLVPIVPNGSQPPLFCLHSGGTHFFFYNLFGKQLKKDRPVFALQASPHEGELVLHNSVNTMAKDFIADIKQVTPHGPYHFISYCYNTAIGVEVCRQLEEKGEQVNLIIADTMADYLSLFNASQTPRRAKAFLGRFVKNPVKTLSNFVKGKFIRPMRERLKTNDVTGSEKIVQELHLNHIEIYRSYQWQPIKSSINLLITKKKQVEFNTKVVASWERVTTGNVYVQPTSGHHDRLFLEGNVIETAKNVDDVMDRYESENLIDNR